MAVAGAEKVLLDLCKNLDKDKFNLHAIGLNHEDYLLKEFLDSGIQAMSLGMQKRPKSLASAVNVIDKYVKENDIDIIHAHMFHPLPIAYYVRLKNPKVKIVFTSHNEKMTSKPGEIFTKSLKKYRDADILFSHDMASSIYLDNYDVVVNGIDIEKYNVDVEKNDKFTFLSIGILRDQKNQKFLIQAAKVLKDRGLDFVIEIVGDGALRDELRELIEKEDVSEYVKMLGLRDDIPILLNRAHVLVMPSHFEGLPIALLESGAAKLPIISTPVGAIPSVVGEDSGYLSSIDDFIETMEYVYNNIDEANEKAIKCYENIVKEYSIQSMALAHEKIYERVCV